MALQISVISFSFSLDCWLFSLPIINSIPDPIINCEYYNARQYAPVGSDINFKGAVSDPIKLSFLYLRSQLPRPLVLQLQLCGLFLQRHLQHRYFIRLDHLPRPLLRSRPHLRHDLRHHRPLLQLQLLEQHSPHHPTYPC